MTNKEKGLQIRRQILRDVIHHPNDLANHICSIFGITPQAVYNHIKQLEKASRLTSKGRGKGKKYYLGTVRDNTVAMSIDANLSEDTIWANHFRFIFDDTPENIKEICLYGFTEMVNNIIDHSGGKNMNLSVYKRGEFITMFISDDGEGIFKRITRLCGLSDERQAILELSKGKLTTDPERHTGEGIFFTSRIFDKFEILSHGLKFEHDGSLQHDFLSDTSIRIKDIGTMVVMQIALASERLLVDVFNEFAGPEDYQFNKTVVPVKLAQYGNEKLVSRSQAKRLLTRVENFQNVVFDFDGVSIIGQAFADEIFRVYANKYPGIMLVPTNMTEEVTNMVKRAQYRDTN